MHLHHYVVQTPHRYIVLHQDQHLIAGQQYLIQRRAAHLVDQDALLHNSTVMMATQKLTEHDNPGRHVAIDLDHSIFRLATIHDIQSDVPDSLPLLGLLTPLKVSGADSGVS
ncbi:hypothetical protein FUT69_08950 [Xylella taiwanensis]|uniref:Uncharacterized protein n=1 Tax=Xylella taiwanensis TaxID=1444770 RepID=Z9JGR7_9GAMM|nr:hypothetical protein [Xylella taiwanensis]AXI82848.1 hypothetical protein AB672_02175 [Xylella taiwanensis]EWS77565.1 hypothetical protein AF72_10150 [Xylella taiwanensis]MCD8455858.1 hypothetical protein [Xylella taiwanensis]MCD8458262.1 hypothetical protein [Xylella taiwanensis]MCD8460399.1 hypothetical protein [Xylella taiwanensis]